MFVSSLAQGVQGLKETLTVTNLANRSRLALINIDDLVRRVVTMDVVTTSAGVFGSVTGLAPAQILYRQSDVREVSIDGGLGGGDYRVLNTVSNGVNPITALNSSRNDSIQILGTTGRLDVTGSGGTTRVRIGARFGVTGGSLDNIRGDITVKSLENSSSAPV